MPRPRLALAIGLLWLATGAVAHSYLVCANWLGDSDDCATALPFFERTAAPPIQAGTPLNFRHTDAPLVESTPLCEATTEPSFGGDGSSLQTFATGTTPITVEPGASVRIAWPDNNHSPIISPTNAGDELSYVHMASDDSPTYTEPLVTLPFDGGSCKKNPSGGEWKLKAQTLGWVCSGEVPIASDLAPGRYTFVWSWALYKEKPFTSCFQLDIGGSSTPGVSNSTVAPPRSSALPSLSLPPASTRPPRRRPRPPSSALPPLAASSSPLTLPKPALASFSPDARPQPRPARLSSSASAMAASSSVLAFAALALTFCRLSLS